MAADTGSEPSAAGRLLNLDDDELVGILVETVGRLAGMATQRTALAVSLRLRFAGTLPKPFAPAALRRLLQT